VLFVLTLPFTLITLGLFLLVLNAIVLWMVSLVVPGFALTFLAAFLAALALSVVGMLWKSLTRDDRRDKMFT
jgi:putative membrane protein